MSEYRNTTLSASAAVLVCSLAFSRRNVRPARIGLSVAFGVAAGVAAGHSYLFPSNSGSTTVAPFNILKPFSSLLNLGVSHCELPKESSLRSFSISDGRAEQEQYEKAVVDVTASSFERLVLNNDKNVLVLFYAPWCGYCKRLGTVNAVCLLRTVHIISILLDRVLLVLLCCVACHGNGAPITFDGITINS